MATAISPHSLLTEVVTEFARLSDTTLVTFPAGDPDPVRIEDGDLQSLQPKRHLSISIIDFYIKYLEKEVLSLKDKDRFFFFNCSFFISNFGTKISSTDNDHEWIRGVNLFEKDYIFIPVHEREHWSLIIIYHLNSLTESPTDVHYRSPCIFHLDSVEGMDNGLEGDIRSFIFKTWTDIHQNSDVLQALFHMRYVEAKVPQEGNGYDSGIYLLHYVELFILESASPDFSFGTEQGKSHFLGWDTSEVVAKREHIQNLIFKLSGMTQLQGTLRLHSSEIFSWLRVKAASEGRIGDVQNSDLTMVNGKGAESEHGGHQTGGVTVLNEHQPSNANQTLTVLREATRLHQEVATRRPVMEEIRRLRQAEESSLQADNDTPILRKETGNRRSRVLNWSSIETSALLDSMVDFHMHPLGFIRWDIIADKVNFLCGSTRDGKQCRSRFDTLKRAFQQVFKFCGDNAKEFSEITEKERLEMRLSTTLTLEWYTLMERLGVGYRKSRKRPFAVEVQIEAPVDCPSSPRIDTDSIPFSSAGEFQSEILPEPPPASPSSRHDGTPVPETLVATGRRPLVQQKIFRGDECEIKGVYRRAVRDYDGVCRRFRYEPRFRPPRERDSLGEPVILNSLSLGSYSTSKEAEIVYRIAAYFYDRGDQKVYFEDGTCFYIPGSIPVEVQSLGGKVKMKWVEHQTKEIFAAFQKEKVKVRTGSCHERGESCPELFA